jgi:CRP-like cAMP-binding protein
LVNMAERRELKKGERLLEAGQICTDFYLVEKGHLRTCYNKEGVLINIRFTLEGAFTSNLQSGKKNQVPSAYSIEAGEKTIVWLLSRRALVELCKESKEMLLFSRRLVTRLLVEVEEHSSMFKIYTPTERYHYLEKNNPQLLQRVSLSQLASYLGITRETLSRIRSKN